MKAHFTFFLLCISFSFCGAQIIYTDIDPDTVITGSNPAKIYNLDFDNDGIKDFTFSIYASGITSCGRGCSGFTSSVEVSPVKGSSDVATDNAYPRAMQAGDAIDSTTLWTDSHNQILRLTGVCFGYGCSGADNAGNWVSSAFRYLGVKLVKGNHAYYGWIRLSVFGTSLKILDYAFSTVANKSIHAGETDCGVLMAAIAFGGSMGFCSGSSLLLTANTNANIFQWLENGMTIPGATLSSYEVTSANLYTVEVKDSCNSFTSDGVAIYEIFNDTTVTVHHDTLAASPYYNLYQWLDCSGMTPIAGATNQYFVPTKQGSYAVQITYIDSSYFGQIDCVDTSSCHYIKLATGIDEAKIVSQLTVAPNPFSRSTQISFSLSKAEKVDLVIYDMMLRTVEILNEQWLNAGRHSYQWAGTDRKGNKLSAGIYFLKMETNNENKTLSISIER